MAMFGGDTAMTIVIRAKNETDKILKQVKKEMKDFQGRIDKMQPAFKKMAVVGTATFGAVAIGAKKAIDEARDFEEETNKFNVVFKDVSAEAEKMADTLNKSYRLSRLESKKLLSATGDILTGFGFTGEKALELSGSVNTLAVDLASFTNAQGGAEAVSSALTKALLGERESLKTYGIAIQEADVQAELLARGMDGLTGEALRQAKAQVTLDIAMRQSKNAIGDTARSSDSLKAAQDQLKATTADLSLAIGTILTPILNNILQTLLPVIDKVKIWVEENPKLTKTIIIGTAALTALVTVMGLLGIALPVIITGFTVLLGPVGLVITAIVLLTATIKKWKDNLDIVMPAVLKIWEKIKDGVGSAVDWIVSKVQKAIDIWNKMISIVSSPIKTAGGLISGTFSKAKSALGFEHGGTIPGPRGMPVPIMAHGQEKIIPANQSGNDGGGLSVTINNPVFRNNEDERRLKKTLDKYFRPLITNHKLSL